MITDIPASYRARAFRDRRDSIDQSVQALKAQAVEHRKTIRRKIDRDNAQISDWMASFDAKRSKLPPTAGPVGLNSETDHIN